MQMPCLSFGKDFRSSVCLSQPVTVPKRRMLESRDLLSGGIRLMRIFVGVPRRGASNEVEWSKPAIFDNFGRHISGAVRVEANIIMQRHEVPCWLSSDLEFE